MSKNRPALKEIARAMGVSPSAISLVLHNKPGIGADTREQIKLKLEEYGYYDSKQKSGSREIYLLKYSAVSFHTGKNDGYTNLITDAILQEAAKAGFSITMKSCMEGDFLKELDMISKNPLDGTIILGTDLPLVYEDYLSMYPGHMVLVDTYMPNCNRDSVIINSSQCMRIALQYLKQAGHKKIGFIHSNFKTFNYTDRIKAFEYEMKELGLEIDKSCIFSVNPSSTGVYDYILRIMEGTTGVPTAIMTDNDTSAIGMLEALKKQYRVPDDVSLISMGDSYYCSFSSPGISTVQIHAYEIGRRSVTLLGERMMQPDLPVCSLSINGTLTQRESVKMLGKEMSLRSE